jgi:hypothetical protein
VTSARWCRTVCDIYSPRERIEAVISVQRPRQHILNSADVRRGVGGGNRPPHVWRDAAGSHNGAILGSGIARSGASLIQGTYGSPHGNLECVAVRVDGTLQHFWRNETTFIWNAGAVFGTGISSPQVMVQAQFGMQDERGPSGNFELCVAVGGRVQHWWRANSGAAQWRHSADFGHDVRAVSGLCQSSWDRNLGNA